MDLLDKKKASPAKIEEINRTKNFKSYCDVRLE
jgi:hypothetical protein